LRLISSLLGQTVIRELLTKVWFRILDTSKEAAGRFLHRARAEVDRVARTGSALVNPNFAAMAPAICVKGVRIEDPAEVNSKLAVALVHPGPVLIDAVVNRMELAVSPYRQRQCEIWRKQNQSAFLSAVTGWRSRHRSRTPRREAAACRQALAGKSVERQVPSALRQARDGKVGE
jgi:hypothetical protein